MALQTVLIDTGPLVSIFRSSQAHHQGCVEALKSLRLPLLTCWPVVTEAAYLLSQRPEEVEALLTSFQSGFLSFLPLQEADLQGIQAIQKRFDDQSFDLADVCLMHLAEREGIDTVFTLDRRDFGIYRTAEGKALRLWPANI